MESRDEDVKVIEEHTSLSPNNSQDLCSLPNTDTVINAANTAFICLTSEVDDKLPGEITFQGNCSSSEESHCPFKDGRSPEDLDEEQETSPLMRRRLIYSTNELISARNGSSKDILKDAIILESASLNKVGANKINEEQPSQNFTCVSDLVPEEIKTDPYNDSFSTYNFPLTQIESGSYENKTTSEKFGSSISDNSEVKIQTHIDSPLAMNSSKINEPRKRLKLSLKTLSKTQQKSCLTREGTETNSQATQETNAFSPVTSEGDELMDGDGFSASEIGHLNLSQTSEDCDSEPFLGFPLNDAQLQSASEDVEGPGPCSEDFPTISAPGKNQRNLNGVQSSIPEEDIKLINAISDHGVYGQPLRNDEIPAEGNQINNEEGTVNSASALMSLVEDAKTDISVTCIKVPAASSEPEDLQPILMAPLNDTSVKESSRSTGICSTLEHSHVSAKNMAKARRILDEAVTGLSSRSSSSDREQSRSRGLMSEGGKEIEVSAESLEKAKSTFEEDPKCFQSSCERKVDALDLNGVISGEDSEAIKDLCTMDDSFDFSPLRKVKENPRNDDKVVECKDGHQPLKSNSTRVTMSMTKDRILSSSVEKVRDDNFENSEGHKNEEFRFGGFKSAGGRKVSVAAESLQKAKSIFGEEFETFETIENATDNLKIGFRASTELKGSLESIQRFKGKGPIPSHQSFTKPMRKLPPLTGLEKIESNISEPKGIGQSPSTSATVSDNEVTEERSVRSNRRVFQRTTKETTRRKEPASQAVKDSFSKAPINFRDELLKNGITLENGESEYYLLGFDSNGVAVEVLANPFCEDPPSLSQEISASTAALLADDNHSVAEELPRSKEVCASPSPLKKPKEELSRQSNSSPVEEEKDVDVEEIKAPENEEFQFGGFRSAGGKKLTVAAESLERAKSIFGEEFKTFETIENASDDLQIGMVKCKDAPQPPKCNSTRVPISMTKQRIWTSSVEKAKDESRQNNSSPVEEEKNIDVENIEAGKNKEFQFGGFRSAGGKKVSVAADSLQRAKSIFGEEFETLETIENPTDDLKIGFGASTELEESLESRKGKRQIPSHQSFTKPMRKLEEIESNISEPKGIGQSPSTSVTVSDNEVTEERSVRSNRRVVERTTKETTSRKEPASQAVKDSFSKAPISFRDELLKNGITLEIGEPEYYLLGFDSNGVAVEVPANPVFEDTPSLSQEVSASTAALLADDDESNVSDTSWFVPYVCSPSLIVDRFKATPLISKPEDFGISNTLSPKLKQPFISPCNTSTPVSLTRNKRKSSGTRLFESPAVKRSKVIEVDPARVDILSWRLSVIAKLDDEINVKRKQKSVPKSSGKRFEMKMKEESVKLVDFHHRTLPRSYSCIELEGYGVRQCVYEITSESASDFRFPACYFFDEEMYKSKTEIRIGDEAPIVLDIKDMAGVEEFSRGLLASPSVDPNLVPDGWVENHYRWIVWKLASMERSYPHLWGGKCLNPNEVMLQLRYRYDRELERSQRSSLRKILECDEPSSRRLICCVASHRETPEKELELELTDGWYSVWTTLDSHLNSFVKSGLIKVGTKLVIQGAELLNCNEGCDPLQIRGEVRLKINANCVRRARWYSKMGFTKAHWPLPLNLSSVLPHGGMVGIITGLIARVYPPLFMSKDKEGKSVFRSSRAENAEALNEDKTRAETAEAIYTRIWAQVEEERQSKNQRRVTRHSARFLSTISQPDILDEVIEQAPDPVSVEGMLTEEQLISVREYRDEKLSKIRREVQEKVKKELKESVPTRVVSHLLRLLIVDNKSGTPAMLTVWRPSEDLSSLLTEKSLVTFLSTTSTGKRNCILQLSSTKSTQYIVRKVNSTNEVFSRKCTLIQEITASLTPIFGELDTVGVVTRVHQVPNGVTKVYLTDETGQRFVSVAFWASLKTFGYEDILTDGSLVSTCNLQWRTGSGTLGIPCVYATEMSTFTQHPKAAHLIQPFSELKKHLPQDMDNFLSKSKAMLEQLCTKSAPVSEHKRPLSPLLVGTITKFISNAAHRSNLSPLGESSIKKKLTQLQSYGPAPSLSPIVLRSDASANIKKNFRSPFRQTEM